MKKKKKKPKDRSAANGRGTDEELRMIQATRRPNFGNRGGARYLHEGDQCCSRNNGCSRVHHDTNRAMIGIGIVCVDVGDLSHR